MNMFPELGEVIRVLTLADYNTRVVMLGALLLGLASGVIGCFTLLRKRALVGDAASHATLPGIALAFIFMTLAGGDGKSLPGLLLGASVAGVAGMGTILAIRHATRLKEDAALGIVLSVYFGLGMALLGVIQKMKLGHAAGLESFIYGKTASMLAADAWLIAGMATVILLATLFLFKELAILCFDQEFAGSQGYPVRMLDAALMGLIVLTVVTGLQAVGLILIIALLIIPPAAARFWTDNLRVMLVLSALMGALSGVLGAAISALIPRMPAGAIIVVVAGVFFCVSMIFGKARGLLRRWLHMNRLRWKTAGQHVIRTLYEWEEQRGTAMPLADLQVSRSWSRGFLKRVLRRVQRDGWIRPMTDGVLRLTEDGKRRAAEIVRNHRLWEEYLIQYAEVAPHHVDRNADQIEHVLGEALVAHLEELHVGRMAGHVVPPSPHPIDLPAQGGAGRRRRAEDG